MARELENTQYIVCYDIENSVVFEVFDDTVDGYERTEQTKELTSAICSKIGQEEKRFILNENGQQAQKVLDAVNDKAKTHFVLAPMTHKYLSNYYIFNADNGVITSKFAKTVEEDNEIMESIIDLWRKGDDVLFTAHNLDYEYSYIRYNTQLLPKLLKATKNYSIIANGTHDIKSLEFADGVPVKRRKGGTYLKFVHKFIIRDSYLMTGKSIKNLGEAYGLPKLDYDYIVTRTDPTQLTEEDYKYNQRDNEIALRAILEIRDQNPAYREDITKMPMSATQHSRMTCRSNPLVNVATEKDGKEQTLEQYHISLSKAFNMPNGELFSKFFNASGGGLIGVNPEQTYKWQDGVFSFDIKSAHPSQAFNKRFPKGEAAKPIAPEEFPSVIKELKTKAKLMMKMPKEFYNSYNPSNDYLLLVELKGVKEKNIHGNIINSLGSGIARDKNRENEINTRQAYNVNPVSKHGKTRSSDSYTKWFYGVDLIYHLTFYDIDEIIIHEGYKYPLCACDEYTMKKFEFYGAAKEEYKKFTKLAAKLPFEEVNEIVQSSELAEEYTKQAISPDNYVEFLDGELLRIKGIFNGIFGQEYQNPVHDEMIFGEDYEILKESHQDYSECIKKTSVHYCVGAYIAMWTRFELACMMWYAMNNGANLFYWATDSIKCNGVSGDLFEGWCYGHTTKYYERNIWNFGAVDCENKGNPISFYTPETLKHIDIMREDKYKDKIGSRIGIHYTISGFKAGVYMKDTLDVWTVRLDENGGFKSEGKPYNDENVKEIKRIMTEYMRPKIIPPEKTGKMVRDRRYAGLETPLGQINFGALQNIGYNLGGYNSDDNIITD